MNQAGNELGVGLYNLQVKAIDSLGLESTIAVSAGTLVDQLEILSFDAVTSGPGEESNLINPQGVAGYTLDSSISIALASTPIREMQFSVAKVGSADNWMVVSDVNGDSTLNEADLIQSINNYTSSITSAGNYNLKVKIYDQNAEIGNIYNTYDGVVNGSLTNTDPQNPLRSGSYYHDYSTTVTAGNVIRIFQGTSPFDDYLQLVNKSTGDLITFNDDGGGNNNSLIVWTNNTGADIEVLVRTTTWAGNATGNFTLTVTNPNTSQNYLLTDTIGTIVDGGIVRTSQFTVNDRPVISSFDAISQNTSDDPLTLVVEGATASTNLVNPNSPFTSSFSISNATGNITKYEYSLDGNIWTEFNGSANEISILGQATSASVQLRVTDQYGLVSVGTGASFHFNSDFSSNPVNGTLYAKNSTGSLIENGILKLTTDTSDQSGNYVIDLPNNNEALSTFQASFSMYIGNGSADGISFNYGNIPNNYLTFAEEGTGSGLRITFDTYSNGDLGYSDIHNVAELWYGNQRIATSSQLDFTTGTFVPVSISINAQGVVSVSYNGNNIISSTLSNWSPENGWRFSLAARTGGLTNDHWIDNLNIDTPGFANNFTIHTPPIILPDAVTGSGADRAISTIPDWDENYSVSSYGRYSTPTYG